MLIIHLKHRKTINSEGIYFIMIAGYTDIGHEGTFETMGGKSLLW